LTGWWLGTHFLWDNPDKIDELHHFSRWLLHHQAVDISLSFCKELGNIKGTLRVFPFEPSQVFFGQPRIGLVKSVNPSLSLGIFHGYVSHNCHNQMVYQLLKHTVDDCEILHLGWLKASNEMFTYMFTTYQVVQNFANIHSISQMSVSGRHHLHEPADSVRPESIILEHCMLGTLQYMLFQLRVRYDYFFKQF